MSEQMLCPVDRTPLVMSERQNIEIDYCPTCRGVWLDRGELDKIIERSAQAFAPQAQPVPPQPQMPPQPPPKPGRGACPPCGGSEARGGAFPAALRSMILSSSPRSSQTPRQVGQ